MFEPFAEGKETRMKPKPKRIAFYGLFGQKNLGNECTLQAIIYNARRYLPDAEVKCICTGAEDTSARHKIPAFPMRGLPGKVRPGQSNPLVRLLRKLFIRIPMELVNWLKAFKALKGTHMLVVGGTGLLVDHTTGPFGYPYLVFKWSIIAKLCGCKLLFVSVGAGPIYHSLSRWFIKFALWLADYRSYRDSFSRKYIESIGFKTNNDPIYPDLAFSLPRAMVPESNNRDRQRLVIGVGLLDYYGQGKAVRERGEREAIYRDYVNKLSTFVAWLFANKYTVRVLIGDVLYDSPVKEDLIELLRKRELKYEDGQFIDEPILTVEQLLSQLGKSDIVVSPRFHNIILALMLNKPVISLSHNEKFDSLMAELEFAEYCQHIDHLDIDSLIERFMKLEKNAEKLRPLIRQKIEEYRRALDEQYNIIFNNI